MAESSVLLGGAAGWKGGAHLDQRLVADDDGSGLGAAFLADEFGLGVADGGHAGGARLGVEGGDGGGGADEVAGGFAGVLGSLEEHMAAGHAVDVEPEFLGAGAGEGEEVVVLGGLAGPSLPAVAQVIAPVARDRGSVHRGGRVWGGSGVDGGRGCGARPGAPAGADAPG